MNFIILIVFGLIILWMIVSQIVAKILNSIEDRAIRQSGLKDNLKITADSINLQLDAQIAQTKKALESLKEDLYQKLPDLKDRVLRDRRRVDYIHNVLPYKKNFKRRRR